jgi:hypothetical protein
VNIAEAGNGHGYRNIQYIGIGHKQETGDRAKDMDTDTDRERDIERDGEGRYTVKKR